MERRALLCQAILAQEAGDLEKALELLNQADLRRELSYPIESVLDREATLAAALQAREEGRYEDAIRILTRSILEPEMVAELQQQIVEEQDARIMAQAQAAMDDLDPATAIQTLRGLSKAEDQLAWEQAFTETWAGRWRSLSVLNILYISSSFISPSACMPAFVTLNSRPTNGVCGGMSYPMTFLK